MARVHRIVPRMRDRSRDLRRRATRSEGALWRLLRGRRFDGLKFRRQHVVGPFVADFYCAEAKLKCKEEFVACVKRTGFTLDQMRAYAADHRELRRPTLNVPKQDGVIGKAANFLLFVAEKMRAEGAAPEAARTQVAASV